MVADDVPVQWSGDGAAVYVARGAGVPWVIEARVACAVDLTHAAGPEGTENLVRTEPTAGGQGHGRIILAIHD
jgi:hypothetical protein